MDRPPPRRAPHELFPGARHIEKLMKPPLPTGPQGQKLHYSNWFITLSSNIPAKEKNQDFIDKVGAMLKAALRCALMDPVHLYGNPPEQPGILEINTRFSHYSGDQQYLTEGLIYKQPKLKTGPIEIGDKPRGRRIHIHGVLEVMHFTYLRINRKQFNIIIQHCMNEAKLKMKVDFPKRVYLHVNWVPSVKPFLNYLVKPNAVNPFVRNISQTLQRKLISNEKVYLDISNVKFWESFDWRRHKTSAGNVQFPLSELKNI